jgi:subtilisin family serine protease
MKERNSVFLLVSIAALSLLLSAPIAAASDVVVTQDVETEIETSSEPVEVLVTLEDPEGVSVMEERKTAVKRSQRELIEFAETREGVRVLNEFWISNAVLLELEPDFDHGVFRNIEGVRSVRSNTEVEILDTSSSPETVSSPHPSGAKTRTGLSTQTTSTYDYGVDQINAPDVWSQYGTKGGGVNVAVLDTGVNASHPDIDLRTTDPGDPTHPGGWAEFDSNGKRVTGSTPYDSDGHGTHVSGTVAGENTGVAPDANLMHGLVVNGRRGTLSQALSGMEWAVENDADVVTMSLGGPTEDAWINAVENANDMGVVVVAASGNDGPGTSTSPGNVYDTVSVGAVDPNLDVAGFSGGEAIDTDATWGNSALADWPDEYVVPDVVAAGVGINSTSADGGYTRISGTSMATPHVAGAVALAESASGGVTVGEISNAFSLTAFGSGSQKPGRRYGKGAADALAATEFLRDGASVSGTVVDGSGSPVEEAELRVNGVHVDTNGGDYSVGLAEGSWSFEATAPGYEDRTETVSLSKDENAANDITLNRIEPPFFEVSGLDGPPEAETGEYIEVNATVTNTGDESGTQDVTLRLAGSGEALDGTTVETRSSVSLGPGASKTVGFTVSAPSSEGEYDYGVFTDDSSETDTMTVKNAPAFFEVENLKSPKEAETEEEITVNATVENTGGETGEQNVSFRISDTGEPLDTPSVAASKEGLNLSPGENQTVEFVVSAPSEEGEYNHGIFSENDSAGTTLTVEEQALFTVTLISSFENPPTNTGRLDPNLYEDINGDGDGLDPSEAVLWWSRLVQNPEEFDGLTQEQVDALDWNEDGNLSPADAVTLWSKKVQAQAADGGNTTT